MQDVVQPLVSNSFHEPLPHSASCDHVKTWVVDVDLGHILLRPRSRRHSPNCFRRERDPQLRSVERALDQPSLCCNGIAVLQWSKNCSHSISATKRNNEGYLSFSEDRQPRMARRPTWARTHASSSRSTHCRHNRLYDHLDITSCITAAWYSNTFRAPTAMGEAPVGRVLELELPSRRFHFSVARMGWKFTNLFRLFFTFKFSHWGYSITDPQ